MSAFVVDKHHVDVLLSAALKPGRYTQHGLHWWNGESHEITLENADAIGQMLLDECVASVSDRYPNDDLGELPGSYTTESPAPGIEPISIAQWLVPYRYEDPRIELTPTDIFGAISCYEYQSCEHDGWKDSEAKVFCEALREDTIDRLPQTGDEPWEWTAEAIDKRRRGERVKS